MSEVSAQSHTHPRADGHPRGDLRIYLGAAPGVGKTWAMLNEGRRLRDEGRDVIVGYVEAHGRAETAAQVGDLEVIPRRRIPYRSIHLEEMDVDAILERHPEIVLVDELAHTNAAGAARPKRWQDVEVLRDAGIDVITTLNIQHIAELGDIVAGITGVTVRETVPDAVLDEATEIQLVDLPAEQLIERLEQGRIYPAERVRQALEHFFREGNLTALRELALRRTAAGVNERLTDMMFAGTDFGNEVAERVVVLLSDAPAWGDVLRNGWRLADALHGELIVLLVDDGRDHDPAAVQRHRELAVDLGASVTRVEALGSTMAERVEAIADGVRAERGTVVVAGISSRAPRWWWGPRRITELPLLEGLMLALAGVDLHLVRIDDVPTHDS